LHPLVDDLPCPVIQYTDDTLLILRAEHSQVRRLKVILDLFSQATGLHIKFHKSTFVPVGGVPKGLASELAGILGRPISSFPQTYLGLPLSDHKLPASALEFLSVKISKRIPGWRTSLLPIGGRLTLTNAVLSALPSFAMSVLPIPKGTLAKMDSPDVRCSRKRRINAMGATARSHGTMNVGFGPRVASALLIWACKTGASC
jgi:hypothetical protein